MYVRCRSILNLLLCSLTAVPAVHTGLMRVEVGDPYADAVRIISTKNCICCCTSTSASYVLLHSTYILVKTQINEDTRALHNTKAPLVYTEQAHNQPS